jgi:uncharacterized RDD family membrane protein YckC
MTAAAAVAVPRSRYAGIVTRATAFLLDVVLLNVSLAAAATVIGLAVSMLVPGDGRLGNGVIAAALGGSFLLMAGYFVVFWTLAGQTVGMRFMGLRVESLTGGRPAPGRAIVRVCGMVLAAIPLFAGYALILFDDRRQALQDKLAGTVVVYVPRA